ncbi:MAG: DUF2971 domain-containing protein [candidate division Zixibacteria bacterium]|jgi:hypothetical protein|nr:DUF2971 domain-containing protein [candidate division Zixibacteria bacterium]
MIYKYTKLFPSICKNLEFRFSSPKELNDPFEGHIDYSSIENIASKMTWEIEFDKADLLEIAKAGIWFGDIRIFSLSKTCDSPLMWSHYADRHRGVVIGFNEADNFFNQDIIYHNESSFPSDKFGKLLPMQYGKKKIELMDSFKRLPILYKSEDWIYEQEVRFVLPKESVSSKTKNESGADIDLFKIPESTLVSIILGANCDSTDLVRDLQGLLKRNPRLSHVKIFKAEINLSYFIIDFKEIILD